MIPSEWASQFRAVHMRVTDLCERADDSLTSPQELLPEALEELQTALEELRVAQEELRQQNEELAVVAQMVEIERQRYQELFEFAPDAYLVTDIHGTVHEANCAAALLLNIAPKHLIHKPLVNFIAVPQRGEFRRRLLQLTELDRLQDWTVRLQPRAGEPVEGAITVAVVRDLDGQRISLRWLLRDITERRQAEEQIRALNAELEQRVRERTAQLEAANDAKDELLAREQAARAAAEAAWQRLALQAHLLDEVQAAVIVTDLAGIITHWNPHAEALFGWSRAEAIGTSILERAIAPGDAEAALRIMERVRGGEGWKGEWLVPPKEGPPIHVCGTVSPVHDTEGQLVGLICVSVDITDQMTRERRRAAQHAVTRILAEAATLGDAISRILEAIGENLGWDWGALWTVDRHADVLRCTHVWHPPSIDVTVFEELSHQTTFTRGVGLPGRVWASREPAWVPDVIRDDNFPRAPAAAQAGLHGAFSLPILCRGQVLGVLEFFSQEIRPPDGELLQTMATVGGQIGQFMERRRAEEALRGSEERLRDSEAAQRFLSEAASALAATFDAPEALQHVARLAVHYLADWCIIDLLSEDQQIEQVAVAHLDPAKVELSRELRRRYPPQPGTPHSAWSVLSTGKSELIADVPDSLLVESAYDAEHLQIKRQLALRSFMRVPLLARERILGALWLATADSGRRYGPADLALAEDLARRIALAVDNARLYQDAMAEVQERQRAEEALRKSNERLQLLSETASQLLTADQPQAFIQNLFERLSSHLGLEVYFNYLLDEEKGALRLHSHGGVPDEVAAQIEWVEIGQAVCGLVARERSRMVAENVQPSADPRTELVGSLGITAYACYPLLAQGRPIGTLSFGTRRRAQFDPEEVALMQTVADQVAVALDRARLASSLRPTGAPGPSTPPATP